jgi:hypothetical protein
MFKQIYKKQHVGAKSNVTKKAYVPLVMYSANLPREKLPTRQFHELDQLLAISAALSFH